jgi:hypothetical protein
MKSSNSITEIAIAMAKLQIRIEDASANAENKHLKNSYANLQSVLETIRVPMSAVGLSFIQLPSYSEETVYLETVLMHVSGEWMASTSAAPLTKKDAQGVGATLTYLRRYALAALVGITQADDDGQSIAIKSAGDKLVSFAQADRLQKLLDRCPESTREWFAENHGTASAVPKNAFDRLYAGIKAGLDKKEGEQA